MSRSELENPYRSVAVERRPGLGLAAAAVGAGAAVAMSAAGVAHADTGDGWDDLAFGGDTVVFSGNVEDGLSDAGGTDGGPFTVDAVTVPATADVVFDVDAPEPLVPDPVVVGPAVAEGTEDLGHVHVEPVGSGADVDAADTVPVDAGPVVAGAGSDGDGLAFTGDTVAFSGEVEDGLSDVGDAPGAEVFTVDAVTAPAGSEVVDVDPAGSVPAEQVVVEPVEHGHVEPVGLGPAGGDPDVEGGGADDAEPLPGAGTDSTPIDAVPIGAVPIDAGVTGGGGPVPAGDAVVFPGEVGTGSSAADGTVPPPGDGTATGPAPAGSGGPPADTAGGTAPGVGVADGDPAGTAPSTDPITSGDPGPLPTVTGPDLADVVPGPSGDEETAGSAVAGELPDGDPASAERGGIGQPAAGARGSEEEGRDRSGATERAADRAADPGDGTTAIGPGRTYVPTVPVRPGEPVDTSGLSGAQATLVGSLQDEQADEVADLLATTYLVETPGDRDGVLTDVGNQLRDLALRSPDGFCSAEMQCYVGFYPDPEQQLVVARPFGLSVGDETSSGRGQLGQLTPETVDGAGEVAQLHIHPVYPVERADEIQVPATVGLTLDDGWFLHSLGRRLDELDSDARARVRSIDLLTGQQTEVAEPEDPSGRGITSRHDVAGLPLRVTAGPSGLLPDLTSVFDVGTPTTDLLSTAQGDVAAEESGTTAARFRASRTPLGDEYLESEQRDIAAQVLFDRELWRNADDEDTLSVVWEGTAPQDDDPTSLLASAEGAQPGHTSAEGGAPEAIAGAGGGVADGGEVGPVGSGATWAWPVADGVDSNSSYFVGPDTDVDALQPDQARLPVVEHLRSEQGRQQLADLFAAEYPVTTDTEWAAAQEYFGGSLRDLSLSVPPVSGIPGGGYSGLTTVELYCWVMVCDGAARVTGPLVVGLPTHVPDGHLALDRTAAADATRILSLHTHPLPGGAGYSPDDLRHGHYLAANVARINPDLVGGLDHASVALIDGTMVTVKPNDSLPVLDGKAVIQAGPGPVSDMMFIGNTVPWTTSSGQIEKPLPLDIAPRGTSQALAAALEPFDLDSVPEDEVPGSIAGVMAESAEVIRDFAEAMSGTGSAVPSTGASPPADESWEAATPGSSTPDDERFPVQEPVMTMEEIKQALIENYIAYHAAVEDRMVREDFDRRAGLGTGENPAPETPESMRAVEILFNPDHVEWLREEEQQAGEIAEELADFDRRLAQSLRSRTSSESPGGQAVSGGGSSEGAERVPDGVPSAGDTAGGESSAGDTEESGSPGPGGGTVQGPVVTPETDPRAGLYTFPGLTPQPREDLRRGPVDPQEFDPNAVHRTPDGTPPTDQDTDLSRTTFPGTQGVSYDPRDPLAGVFVFPDDPDSDRDVPTRTATGGAGGTAPDTTAGGDAGGDRATRPQPSPALTGLQAPLPSVEDGYRSPTRAWGDPRTQSAPTITSPVTTPSPVQLQVRTGTPTAAPAAAPAADPAAAPGQDLPVGLSFDLDARTASIPSTSITGTLPTPTPTGAPTGSPARNVNPTVLQNRSLNPTPTGPDTLDTTIDAGTALIPTNGTGTLPTTTSTTEPEIEVIATLDPATSEQTPRQQTSPTWTQQLQNAATNTLTTAADWLANANEAAKERGRTTPRTITRRNGISILGSGEATDVDITTWNNDQGTYRLNSQGDAVLIEATRGNPPAFIPADQLRLTPTTTPLIPGAAPSSVPTLAIP